MTANQLRHTVYVICMCNLSLSLYVSVCVCVFSVGVSETFPLSPQFSLLHIKFIFFSSFFLAFFVTISVNWKFQKELHKFIKVSTTNFVCCTFWVFGMQKFLIFN